LKATGDLKRKGDYEESFARAQFQDLDDSKKLSSPAYEKEIGGLELSADGDQVKSGKMTVRHVRYELITIDSAFKRFRFRFVPWLQSLFGHFLGKNAAALSDLSYHNKKQFQPREEMISIRNNGYTVAVNFNNTAYNTASFDFSSQAKAEAFMQGEIVKDPVLADTLHVIPNYEVNLAS
ncbi:MAG: hypothetical protein KDE26_19120, partial [Bacteroidetes bacterium]|nr:hypothetical protein [Bacteroidota bacterium]